MLLCIWSAQNKVNTGVTHRDVEADAGSSGSSGSKITCTLGGSGPFSVEAEAVELGYLTESNLAKKFCPLPDVD